MKNAVIFLADGTESCEALITADLLQRAGIHVTTASVMGRREVLAAPKARITADCTADLRGEYRETPLLRAAAQWLDAYFGGKKPSPGLLPLAPEGNAFQQAVWRHLLAIPYGETATYRNAGPWA